LPYLSHRLLVWRRYNLWCAPLFRFIQLSVASSLLVKNIIRSILYLVILSLYSTLNFRSQVHHPYSTAWKLWFCLFQVPNFWIADEKTRVPKRNTSRRQPTLMALYLNLNFHALRSKLS
jgi:hypothetical protein